MPSDDRYRRAKQRINEIKGFYSHFATYGGVMGLLFLIDLLAGGAWWFFWPLFGWGIGIVVHAASVFGSGWLSSDWERKKIEDLMNKME